MMFEARGRSGRPPLAGLQSGSVQIFYRATGRLSTGDCSQSGPAASEQVAGGGQRGERQESESEAANTSLRA